MPSHHLHLIFLLLFWCRFVAGAVYWSIIELIQNELSCKNNLRSRAWLRRNELSNNGLATSPTLLPTWAATKMPIVLDRI